MRDTHYIVEQTAKALGLSEDLVNNVIRSANEDYARFMAQKEGYSILVPQLGRFEFRVCLTDRYIERKRHTKAKNMAILTMPEINSRTVDACNRNINQVNFHIERTLHITKEFEEQHERFYKTKRTLYHKNNQADLSRLDEYLNVEELIPKFTEPGKISPEALLTMRQPSKRPDGPVQDL